MPTYDARLFQLLAPLSSVAMHEYFGYSLHSFIARVYPAMTRSARTRTGVSRWFQECDPLLPW